MYRGAYRKSRRVYCGRTYTAKIRYKDLKDAKIARSKLMSKRDVELTIYRCPDCGGYHVTKGEGYRNRRTAWEKPDSAVSSEYSPHDPEESNNG